MRAGKRGGRNVASLYGYHPDCRERLYRLRARRRQSDISLGSRDRHVGPIRSRRVVASSWIQPSSCRRGRDGDTNLPRPRNHGHGARSPFRAFADAPQVAETEDTEAPAHPALRRPDAQLAHKTHVSINEYHPPEAGGIRQRPCVSNRAPFTKPGESVSVPYPVPRSHSPAEGPKTLGAMAGNRTVFYKSSIRKKGSLIGPLSRSRAKGKHTPAPKRRAIVDIGDKGWITLAKKGRATQGARGQTSASSAI